MLKPIVVIDSLQGKSLAEKSTLMAQAWRQMDETARSKYCHNSDEAASSTEDTEELSPAEKRKLVMRVAKRHQGDVCVLDKSMNIPVITGKYVAVSWMQCCHNDVC